MMILSATTFQNFRPSPYPSHTMTDDEPAGLPVHQDIPIAELRPAAPLWQRAPTRLEDGRPSSDFLMLIPLLNRKPRAEVMRVVGRIEVVFDQYLDNILFADLNLRLNLLWVSVRPVPGLCLDLPATIHHAVPEARLIAQPPHTMARRRGWRRKAKST